MDHILEEHQEAMVERCRSQRLILAIQDTTFLKHNGLEATKGRVGGGSDALGIAVHAGVAFSEGGSSLGLFHLDADFRLKPDQKKDEPDDKESRRWLDGYDKAVELAAACPSTRVLVICDREGDIWDLLARSTRPVCWCVSSARHGAA